MNLIVFVDRKRNLEDLRNLEKYSKVMGFITHLIYGEVIVVDNSTSFILEKKKDLLVVKFDEEKEKSDLPFFWEPASLDINKTVSTHEDLFKVLTKYSEDSIYIFSGILTKYLLPFSKYIYQVSCNEDLGGNTMTFDPKLSDNYVEVKVYDPIFDQGRTFTIVKYMAKNIKKYVVSPRVVKI